LDKINPDIQHEMYMSMQRIRLVEEAIADRYGENEMRCPVHLSIGQEGVAVGVSAALRREDKVFSTHRAHAHYLAKGGSLKRMLAEIYGKAAGCVGGRGGSMHLMDPDEGFVAGIPIVSSAIPLAVGSALADKRMKRDSVTVGFFGDASVEEGVFHESANFAVLHKLPVLFVCEQNLYSVYTPLRERQPDRPLSDLARGHGMNVLSGDGNDVEKVYALSIEAVEKARNGEGPSFLLLDTYRWREHCGPNYDNNLGYRTEGEFEEWRECCPVENYRKKLLTSGCLQSGQEETWTAEIDAEISEAFEFARSAPLPDPESAGLFTYA
jgi:TPP-dependent pyruvate/acetoin dehydrogenase alpha subunit